MVEVMFGDVAVIAVSVPFLVDFVAVGMLAGKGEAVDGDLVGVEVLALFEDLTGAFGTGAEDAGVGAGDAGADHGAGESGGVELSGSWMYYWV